MSGGGVLSLGSNLGDRLGHLQAGLQVLRERVEVVAVSPVYETDPIGGPAQPDYLNAVVLTGPVEPAALLAAARAAEAAQGRRRSGRDAPRTLDVDVVCVGALLSGDPELTLPHPRAHLRAFVLAPWLDLDPAAVLPGRGAVAELLAQLLAEAGSSGVRLRADLRLR